MSVPPLQQRPAVLGGGKPLFVVAGTPLDRRLLDVEMLPDDTGLLRYQPVGERRKLCAPAEQSLKPIVRATAFASLRTSPNRARAVAIG